MIHPNACPSETPSPSTPNLRLNTLTLQRLLILPQTLNLQLANLQHGKPHLTKHMLRMPLPPLRLLLHAHRLRLNPHNPRPSRKQPLIQIVNLLSVVCGPLDGLGGLEGVVARANVGGAVEPEHIAGGDVGHEEGQADGVAFCDEVGPPVDVDGHVVRGLRVQQRQEGADGGREVLGHDVLARVGCDGHGERGRLGGQRVRGDLLLQVGRDALPRLHQGLRDVAALEAVRLRCDVCAEGEEEGRREGRPCLGEGIASCAGEEGHGGCVGGGLRICCCCCCCCCCCSLICAALRWISRAAEVRQSVSTLARYSTSASGKVGATFCETSASPLPTNQPSPTRRHASERVH
jgi:hypothetical protein